MRKKQQRNQSREHFRVFGVFRGSAVEDNS